MFFINMTQQFTVSIVSISLSYQNKILHLNSISDLTHSRLIVFKSKNKTLNLELALHLSPQIQLLELTSLRRVYYVIKARTRSCAALSSILLIYRNTTFY